VVQQFYGRVSGWYRRQTQALLLAMSVAIVIGANADTFVIAKALWKDPALRQVVVAQAHSLGTSSGVLCERWFSAMYPCALLRFKGTDHLSERAHRSNQDEGGPYPPSLKGGLSPCWRCVSTCLMASSCHPRHSSSATKSASHVERHVQKRMGTAAQPGNQAL
jgi:hypothetical protein